MLSTPRKEKLTLPNDYCCLAVATYVIHTSVQLDMESCISSEIRHWTQMRAKLAWLGLGQAPSPKPPTEYSPRIHATRRQAQADILINGYTRARTQYFVLRQYSAGAMFTLAFPRLDCAETLEHRSWLGAVYETARIEGDKNPIPLPFGRCVKTSGEGLALIGIPPLKVDTVSFPFIPSRFHIVPHGSRVEADLLSSSSSDGTEALEPCVHPPPLLPSWYPCRLHSPVFCRRANSWSREGDLIANTWPSSKAILSHAQQLIGASTCLNYIIRHTYSCLHNYDPLAR